MLFTCQNCDQEFQSYSKGRKYCSRSCYLEAMPGQITNICPICNKEYKYYLSCHPKGKNYCSRKCRKMAHRIGSVCPICKKTFWYNTSMPLIYCSRSCARIADAEKPNRPPQLGPHPKLKLQCDYCGQTIFRGHSEIQKRDHHFCSQSCFGKWLSAYKVGKEHHSYSSTECIFKKCGKTFAVQPNELERGYGVFCSRQCKHDYGRVYTICEQCGKDITVAKSQQERYTMSFCSIECKSKWQSIHCAGENAPNWKGGYDPYYGASWREARRQARKRDNHTCQYPGCDVTREDLGKALNVHHIIPFREFGVENHEEANDLSNLICLCNVHHTYVEHNGLP